MISSLINFYNFKENLINLYCFNLFLPVGVIFVEKEVGVKIFERGDNKFCARGFFVEEICEQVLGRGRG